MGEVVSRPDTYQRARKTGLDMMGHVPLGTHICHFYQTKKDLVDILVPYFKAGLEGNQLCIWITSEPLPVREAKAVLSKAVKDVDKYISKGQLEILDDSQWVTNSGRFDAEKALHSWVEKQNQSAQRGFDTLRLSGNPSWLDERDWSEWINYEAALDNVIEKNGIIGLCSFCLDKCGIGEVIDAVNSHHMTLMRRGGEWEAIDNIGHSRAKILMDRQGQILDQLHDALVTTDLDGYVISWNNAATRLYGHVPEEVLGKHITFLYPKEGHEFLLNHVIGPVKKKGSHDVEVRVRRKSGEEAYVHLFLSLLRDGNGSATSIISSGLDVTERKRAEDLRLSQERFSKAFHSSPDAIVISTVRDGRFIDVNESLLRTTGYSRAEVIGRTSNELGFWPKPEERTRFVGMLRKQGFVRDLEVRFRMKQGELRVGLLSAQVIYSGGELCSVAIMHDITERKRVEEELRRSQEQLRNLSEHLQRAREEERACIAREIHDELGQALTALKMDLSWLGKRLPFEKDSLYEKVGAMSKLIDTTTQSVRRISTQLRPGLLDDLGLVAAIEWQAQEFQERTKIRCKLALHADDIVLNRELSTTCFRIFQEALTNVARHADATRVMVTLKRNADRLSLEVIDNGKGITKEEISHPKSFGLLGMLERARFCGGDVKISGIQGKGTTVVAVIPLRPEGESI
ncbi:MAG: PAS domain S-box protein [Desulfobacteraceae bacterium]|jgi:PAS domain S-box-containing protein